MKIDVWIEQELNNVEQEMEQSEGNEDLISYLTGWKDALDTIKMEMGK